jgi:hypothetical protein
MYYMRGQAAAKRQAERPEQTSVPDQDLNPSKFQQQQKTLIFAVLLLSLKTDGKCTYSKYSKG